MSTVVVLEDTRGRVDAIRRVVGPRFDVRVFERAPDFVAWIQRASDVALISLDYHLGPRAAGTGMDAARALVQLGPLAPVILHSSDSTGAAAQEAALVAAGWRTERFPFSELVWAAAFERLAPAAS